MLIYNVGVYPSSVLPMAQKSDLPSELNVKRHLSKFTLPTIMLLLLFWWCGDNDDDGGDDGDGDFG